jgi:predicted enzyme related to lactoylglutathione lyase
MSENHFEPGSIGWTDLTVGNAEELRDFYPQAVVWRPEPVA